jgi:hypothetical protein
VPLSLGDDAAVTCTMLRGQAARDALVCWFGAMLPRLQTIAEAAARKAAATVVLSLRLFTRAIAGSGRLCSGR